MLTVLLADTDPDTRRILREFLGANGFRVDVCDTTAEMVERVLSDPPDAVVVEPYVMGGDPVEVVRMLRSPASRGEEGAAPVPVLVYTSSPWRSVLEEAEVLGASILTKPARPGRVLLVLEALLRGGAPDLPPPDPGRHTSLGR